MPLDNPPAKPGVDPSTPSTPSTPSDASDASTSGSAVDAAPAADHPRSVRTQRSDSATLRVALLAAAIGAVVGSLIAGALVWEWRAAGDASPASAPSAGVAQPKAGAPARAIDIHALIEQAQSAVVAIHTNEKRAGGVFGSSGSGVVISEDGLVLTNSHVVNTVTKLKVVFADGTEHIGAFVGSSPDDDIALLKIADPPKLTPAKLGSSGDVQVGDDVLAIGNALDLGGSASVTKGIVSAKDRSIHSGALYLRNLLQTDAAINPGNSGGPLLNRAGEVVGINTALVSDAQNVGFAISIDVVKPLIDSLRDGKGKITPDTAYLGVTTTSVREVSQAVRDHYKVTSPTGAFIQEITEKSAATDADLKLGDVITAIDGSALRTSPDVGAFVRSHAAGDTIRLDVQRQGASITVDVTLRSRKATGT